MPHSELSGQKKVRAVSKTTCFFALPLVTGVMVTKLYMFSDLTLITHIMVEYSDDFQGLSHSENLDLSHSAEPKINVCPIAKILKTGIG